MEYDQTPDLDEVETLLTTLAHEQCRTVVAYFRDRDEHAAGLDEITDYVQHQNGGEETDGDTDALAGRLHHVALPRLADAGFLEYDPRSNTVRYHGHPQLEALLSRIEDSR